MKTLKIIWQTISNGYVQLGTMLFFSVLFGSLENWYDWAHTPFVVSVLVLGVWSVVLTIFAWVINPIRNRGKKW